MEIDRHNESMMGDVDDESTASPCLLVSLSPCLLVSLSLRRLWPWLVWIGVLIGAALGLGMAQAQGNGPARAGLVIQLAVDRVISACVNLGDDGQATGEEVLRAAGLPLVIEYTPGIGGAVCKIDNQGCDFPSSDCFCQCTLERGVPCRYWAYNQLVGGQWRYASQGTTSAVVHAGDVEGWAWGEGTTSSGAQPPVKTFAELCAQQQVPSTATVTTAPATNTTVATQPPTAVPPTVSATATTVPRVAYLPAVDQQAALVATATVPTSTRTATQAPAAQGAAATATRQASATPRRVASATAVPPTRQQATKPLTPSATADNRAGNPPPAPSNTAAPTVFIESPTTTAAEVGAATEIAQVPPTSFVTPAASPILEPTRVATLPAATSTVLAVAGDPVKIVPTTGAPNVAGEQQPAPGTSGTVQDQPATSNRGQAGGYLVFGVLVLALAAGWIYFQRRQRQ